MAVALTPEMLPVIVTTALARGASSLARDDNVIVKRLPALHDLGAIDVLCTDKTGTLTQDRPVLHCHLDPDGRSDPRVLRWAALNAWWTLHLAELPVPDPLDEAILDAVAEDAGTPDTRTPDTRTTDTRTTDTGTTGASTTDAGAEYGGAEGEGGPDLDAYEGIAALPIDAKRRLSTAVVAESGSRPGGRPGPHVLVVKGAPEEVLARCARVRTPEADADLDDEGRVRLTGVARDLAEDGLRVLGVALVERRPGFGANTYTYTTADERGLTFVGFVGLRDAAADTAVAALAALARHDVAVKVLTGDHPGTAARACRDIGLPPGTVVTADHLDDLSDPELTELVRTATVFARCRPEHKARIVDTLRANGHVVGFLGDGVNDLPALEAADVGICPRDAVDVVREAADVVLAEKGLTAIDAAIGVGRRTGGNIATYLRITLSSNLGNVIAMLAAGLLLPFLPMLPAQVLVQNLCFDAAQLAFAFDRPRTADLGRQAALGPRDVLRFVTGFGLLNALADLATFAVLALVIHTSGAGGGQALFHAGWFTENLLTQAMVMVLLRGG
ncbi:HAD-IC family P-type ATPase, partial [Streptomyces sp. SID3343]|uniref:HAD-IC family P-type ATPase n=1 Tax=Streptomyces sp. SID3343 TaxID=2690260 RepID=UPI0031F80990